MVILRALVLAGVAWLGGEAAAAGEDLSALRPVEHLSNLPAGLLLPVTVEHTCRAGRCPAGERLQLPTVQKVPLSATEYLPRGAKVEAVVVRSEDSGRGNGAAASLALRFEALVYAGQRVPLHATAIAAANLVEVSGTTVPINGITDRGLNGEANWTTRQVGGDVVTRAGWTGDVNNQVMEPGGRATFDGVYTKPAEGSGVPRALGSFSAGASGLYGYPEKARMVTEAGALSLQCACSLVLRRGDDLLLRVE